MFERCPLAFCAALVCVLVDTDSYAANRVAGSTLCAALVRLQIEESPSKAQAMFLPSYLPSSAGPPLPAALQNTAFVYDNSLAAMAFLACGEIDRARSIGDALIVAGGKDRFYTDGRLRNAYRAGPVTDTPALPGWWDDRSKVWAEDEYQVSTASGNVAWAALALLQLHEKTKDAKYLEAAERLAIWLDQLRGDDLSPGVAGGYYGFEPNASHIAWKSTEHNIDILAVGRWLSTASEAPEWGKLAESTLRFVTSMRDDKSGFLIGTDLTGNAVHSTDLWLDVQIWPFLVVPDSQRPPEWGETIGLMDARLAVTGGYDFNGDRDGLWVEGTAQAALLLQQQGEQKRASELIASILENVDPQSGLLYATSGPPLSTGLTVGAMGQGGAFMYQHWPHLGATAWAVMAAMDFNPFRPN